MSVFEDLANRFIRTTDPYRGQLVRPNDTHFSLALAAQGLQWIRAALSEGQRLTSEGERFVAAAAAYLGYLAYLSYDRRGFEVALSAQFEPGSELNHLALFVSRRRDGAPETYDQDFLRDVHRAVLRPEPTFPAFREKSFELESLTLPSVEYLYMLGVHFMDSPWATGSWPRGESHGGIEEDFVASRGLLVDDLHRDINVPVDDAGLRELSHWVVWPPYGWDDNQGQAYNLMTLVDQIGIREVVPLDEGVAYLRALLCSQLFHLRNLAARTLMVLGQPPAVPEETIFYLNAVNASDSERATGPMVRFRWVLEGNDPGTAPGEGFVDETGQYWQEMLRDAPREDWTHAPILRDPLYRELAEGTGEVDREHMDKIDALRSQYPGDRFADIAYGYALLKGPDPGLGETLLQEAVECTTGDVTAHNTLASWYASRGDEEAAARLHADAVRLRPWDPLVISNAMWFLTRDLVG